MTPTRAILQFPKTSAPEQRRLFLKNLLSALRVCESPVVVDLAGRCTLDHEDVDLVLECAMQAAGRDSQLVFVAGSQEVRILLDVIRVSSLARVVNALAEALIDPRDTSSTMAREFDSALVELPRRA
jgi:hypothetical protein